MGKVILDMTMSLDGFVARPDDFVGTMHDWLFTGDTVNPHNDFFRTSGASTGVLNEILETTGAIMTGRRTYDITGGWGGSHPIGAMPVIVVTHSPAGEVPEGRTEFIFVDGVEAAVERAKAAAGERDVHVMGGASIARQCLAAGLLDAIQIHVAPVLLGEGLRLIEQLDDEIELEQDRVVEGPSATHLRYRVVR
jgi:dihydrofolate reductase